MTVMYAKNGLDNRYDQYYLELQATEMSGPLIWPTLYTLSIRRRHYLEITESVTLSNYKLHRVLPLLLLCRCVIALVNLL